MGRTRATLTDHDNNGTGDFAFGANSEADPIQDRATNLPGDDDPFDPARLRLTGDFSAAVGVKKVMLSVPVRKPDKSWWVRVHPSEDYRLQTAVIELKEDREIYLVDPKLRVELSTEATFKPKIIATAINRQGTLFLWEASLPSQDRNRDEWARTAMEAITLAMRGWVRVTANMSLGAYEVYQATAPLPEPEWPEQSFRDLLNIAFRDRFIRDLDHPELRKLRGEA